MPSKAQSRIFKVGHDHDERLFLIATLVGKYGTYLLLEKNESSKVLRRPLVWYLPLHSTVPSTIIYPPFIYISNQNVVERSGQGGLRRPAAQ